MIFELFHLTLLNPDLLVYALLYHFNLRISIIAVLTKISTKSFLRLHQRCNATNLLTNWYNAVIHLRCNFDLYYRYLNEFDLVERFDGGYDQLIMEN